MLAKWAPGDQDLAACKPGGVMRRLEVILWQVEIPTERTCHKGIVYVTWSDGINGISSRLDDIRHIIKNNQVLIYKYTCYTNVSIYVYIYRYSI